MNSKHIKTSLALFSSVTLLAITATAAKADELPDQPVPVTQVQLENEEPATTQAVEQTITREITITNPLNGESSTIKQEAVIRDGEPVSENSNVWPEFIVPYYEGYQPSTTEVDPVKVRPTTKPVKVNIKYTPSTEHIPMNTMVFALIDVDDFGKDDELCLVKEDEDGFLALPTPPAGYRYYNPNLPAKVRYFRGTGHSASFKFLIKKIDAGQSKEEQRSISRKIIFHLPSGDKIVEQTIKAHLKDGKWTIEKFPAVTAPEVAGYEPSQAEIPELQLGVEELDHELKPFEVQYTLIKDDHQDTGTETGEEVPKDGDPSTSEGGTQTEPSAGIDEETQTEGSSSNTGSQTNPTDNVDDSSQTDQPSTNDDHTQTGKDITSDAGSQTDTTGAEDSGDQTEDTSTTDSGNQADSTVGTGEDEQAGKETSSSDDQNNDKESNNSADDQIDEATNGEGQSGANDNESQTEKIDPEQGTQAEDLEDKGEANKADDLVDNEEKQPELPMTGDESSKGSLPTTNVDENDDQLISQEQADSSETNDISPLQTSASPANLQEQLDQLQAPLKSLAHETPHSENAQLPQTGNHEQSTKTTVLGMLVTFWTAVSSLFVLKRKFK